MAILFIVDEAYHRDLYEPYIKEAQQNIRIT